MFTCKINELEKKIDETVTDLTSKGLQPGHILAVHLPTSLQFISLLFASIRIGAIFAPLNLRLPETALQSQLKQLNPKLFISLSGIQIYSNNKPPLLPSSFLLFTSGSNGSPKLVNLSLDNLLSSAKSTIMATNLQPRDTWLLSLPLYHVGGLSILFRCFLSGAALTTDPTNQSITHLSYVPTQLYRSWPIYPRLKTILLSGAPIHEVPEKLPIMAAYGMTETASMILGQKKPIQKEGFIFLGLPHLGKQMSLSEDGEILVKGDSLFQGYWNGIELQKPEEWFPTNDLGLFDPTAGFAIVGRKDNQFISGGENIQPEEIERELLTHPTILDAIVVPKKDAEYGVRPVAFVRASGEIDEKSLRNYLLERLPKYKIPCSFSPLEEGLEIKPSRKKYQSN